MATPIPSNLARFDLVETAHIIGAQSDTQLAGVHTTGVVTDSRLVQPGNLFVALRGERLDAHRFLHEVAANGAGAIVAAYDAPSDLVPTSVPVLRVTDTLMALGDLAQHHRQRWAKPLVAIGGAVGKTTTRGMVQAVLSALGHRVHGTQGNLNNLIGAPMTLLGLMPEHDMAVAELGISLPGEMVRLSAITQPNIAVVTWLAEEHAEHLGGLTQAAHEEAHIMTSLSPEGTVIVNADQPELAVWQRAQSHGRRITYGQSNMANVRLVSVQANTDLTSTATYVIEGEPLVVTLRIPGFPAAYNAGAALAVGLALEGKTGIKRAAEGLSQVVPPPGRMSPHHGVGGALILDDTYNASPDAMREAMRTAAGLARLRGGRLFLILGDMAELGEHSPAYHLEVLREAQTLGATSLLCVGPLMQGAAQHLSAVHGAFENARLAADSIASGLLPTDVVLLKGSRSMRMESGLSQLVTESIPLI